MTTADGSSSQLAPRQPAYARAVWPAPPHVKALTTTRSGGSSQPPFDSFNLGFGAGDKPQCVVENRSFLQERLGLAVQPRWLNQVHGNAVVAAEQRPATESAPPEADACTASSPGLACVILSADCIPLVLADRRGTHVAAAHAGWRGLHLDVIAATCERLPVANDQLIAWLGPAIGQAAYEVGEDLRDRFVSRDRANHRYFIPCPPSGSGKFMADLPGIARRQLQQLGIEAIFGGDYCTYTEARRFYSYRRDGARSGRMATLIWRES